MSLYFLMCSERSGSNFIAKLMNGHSNICGPSIKHLVNPVARNLFRYEPLSEQANWNSLLADIHRLLNVKFTVWRRELSLDDLKSLSPVGDVTSLIRNIFLAEAAANGKQHVFIKENQLYEFQPFLLLNFPEARYVYLTRDPRDMALSWKKSSHHPGGVVSAARRWQYDQQNFLKNYAELKRRGLAYHLRYEDLIEDPKYYCGDVLNFLGQPIEDISSVFYKDEMTRKNAEMHMAWGNLSRAVIRDNKDKYQKELSRDEIGAIERICYCEMSHLGYRTTLDDDELTVFDDVFVAELDAREREKIRYECSAGVKDNMEAKRRFYTHLGGVS